MPGVPDYRNSETPTPHTIPRALATGKLDPGWLPGGGGGGSVTSANFTSLRSVVAANSAQMTSADDAISAAVAAVSVRLNSTNTVVSNQGSAIVANSAQMTSADNALSAAVNVVSNALSNEISIRTSAVNAVSNRLSTWTLDNLADVSAPAPGDGQVLAFNSAQAQWVASTIAAGTGSVTSAELQAVSAAAASADATLSVRINSVMTVVSNQGSAIVANSAQMTSADNAISAAVAAVSARLDSTNTVVSNQGSAIAANSAQMTSADNAISAAVAAVSSAHTSLVSDVGRLSLSVSALNSAVNAVSNRLSTWTLDNLADVSAPAPADGNTILWNSAQAQWVASAPPAGSGSVTSAELQAVSAAAASADGTLSVRIDSVMTIVSNHTSAIQANSAQMTSADNALSAAISAIQSWKHNAGGYFEAVQGTNSAQIQSGDYFQLMSRQSVSAVSTAAVVIDTEVTLAVSAGNPQLLALQNAGTKYFYVDALGKIGIGKENIFRSMDIGITRIVDRGEVSKAWINIAQVDTWPSFTKAGEWWANTGIADCVQVLTWLDNVGTSRDLIWNTGDTDSKLYFAIKKNNIDKCLLQPGAITSAYLFETLTSVAPTNVLFDVKNNGNEIFRIYGGAGNAVVGESSVLSVNATHGFLYLPTTPGTPTGTPDLSVTGKVPIIADTSGDMLWMYDGGAWVAMAGGGVTSAEFISLRSDVGRISLAVSANTSGIAANSAQMTSADNAISAAVAAVSLAHVSLVSDVARISTDLPVKRVLQGAQGVSGTAPVSVSGFTFTCSAGVGYHFEFGIFTSAPISLAGNKFVLSFPSSSPVIAIYQQGGAVGGVSTLNTDRTNVTMANVTVSAVGVPIACFIRGTFRCSANGGTMGLAMGNNISGAGAGSVITVLAGSYGYVWRMV